MFSHRCIAHDLQYIDHISHSLCHPEGTTLVYIYIKKC